MRKKSLSKKLILIVVASTFIMLLSLVMLYCFTYDRAINQQAFSYSQENLFSTTATLSDYFTDLTLSASSLAGNADIRSFLSGDVNTRLTLYSYVQNDISSFVNYKKGVLEIYLLSVNGSRLSSKGESTLQTSAQNLRLLLLAQKHFDYTVPFRKAFYTPILDGGQATDSFALVVPVFESVVVPQSEDYLGCIVILLSTGQSSSLIPITSRGNILIVQDNTPLYVGSEHLLNAWTGHEYSMPERYENHRILSGRVEQVDWTIYYLAVSDTIEKQYGELRTFCFSFGGLLVFMQLLSLVFYYLEFVRPMKTIVTNLHTANSPQFRLTSPRNAAMELDAIVVELNGMLDRIEQLNTAMMANEISHYREKIIFLQAQINPHFLYNNLQCIRGMATFGNSDAIREIASSIATIYRYGSRDGAIATLSEELECADQYLKIINLRYGTEYSIALSADPETMRLRLPKMALQPLVENCIVHGFSRAEKREGRIALAASAAPGILHIELTNDGEPIDPQTLHLINNSRIEDTDEIRHLGVANIRTRLELLFSNQSSLSYRCENGLTIAVIDVVQKYHQ